MNLLKFSLLPAMVSTTSGEDFFFGFVLSAGYVGVVLGVVGLLVRMVFN